MEISRYLGILSLAATVLTLIASLLQTIAPQYAILALALSAAVSAFTARVQGGTIRVNQIEQARGFIGGNYLGSLLNPDLIASFLLSAIARDKRKVRNVCLRIFKAIKTAFADDADFQ